MILRKIVGGALLLLVMAPSWAVDAGVTKVSFDQEGKAPAKGAADTVQALVHDNDVLVLSAPPREDEPLAKETYGPIADYLSQVTGKKIVFKYSGNWLTYQTEMQKGAYDILFDGPHLNGWRVAKLQHNTLVKAPGQHIFVIAVRQDNRKVSGVEQLAGHLVCAMDPPNLGALTLLREFDNPVRQPIISHMNGWDQIYTGLMEGKCEAAVLPLRNLEQYDKRNLTKVIYRGPILPNQAFSAGPRVSPEDQAKIVHALISPQATGPTAKLRALYAIDGSFVPARKEDYVGLAGLLKEVWGFN